MSFLEFFKAKKRCKAHKLVDCPTCEDLESNRIMRQIEEQTKDLKPVKKKTKNEHTKDST